MTDPRIIECAKAVRELLFRLFPDVEHLSSDSAERQIATAVVLKWLEVSTGNGFTWGMMAAGFNNLAGPADDRDKLCIGAAYQAMCEQAKKEIGG